MCNDAELKPQIDCKYLWIYRRAARAEETTFADANSNQHYFIVGFINDLWIHRRCTGVDTNSGLLELLELL